MADLDVGAGAFGGRVRASVSAVSPVGWVGAVALAVIVALAWHFWDRDEEDRSDWTDPQQPPDQVGETRAGAVVGPLLARARRWPGSCPGAC